MDECLVWFHFPLQGINGAGKVYDGVMETVKREGQEEEGGGGGK